MSDDLTPIDEVKVEGNKLYCTVDGRRVTLHSVMSADAGHTVRWSNHLYILKPDGLTMIKFNKYYEQLKKYECF